MSFSPSDSHSARRESLYLCDRRSLRIATHTRTHCTRTFINTALAAINPELTNTKPHDSMFVRREHTHALCGGKVFTDQYGPIRQSLAHAYTLSQRSQSLWDSRCWAASLRLIKTTVRACMRACVRILYVCKVCPLSVPFKLTAGAGLFNRYFINAATMPHHHGNSRTLLIEAKLCFHS